MTLIDDSTRYCYVYLLNTKDEALHYFKSIRQKLRINLKRKLNESGQIVVESTSRVSLIPSVRNTALFMRGCLPIHPSQTGCRAKKPYSNRSG